MDEEKAWHLQTTALGSGPHKEVMTMMGHRITIKLSTYKLPEKNAMFGKFKNGSSKVEGEFASFDVSNEAWSKLHESMLTGETFDDVIVRAILNYHRGSDEKES